MIVRTSTFSRFLFASLLASSAVVACSGDEDDDTDTDTGVDHDGMDHDGTSDGMDNDGMDNDGSGGEDTTPDVTPDGSGGEDTGPQPSEDLCVGEADLAIIGSADADPATEGDQTVTGVAQSCGLGCLADEDPATCAVTCIVDTTGVTTPCATCYGGVVACSIENCLADCAADPSSEACATCQAANCLDAFYTCTGLEAPVQPIVDACIGESDLAIIGSADADPATEGDQTVTGVAQSCGLGCLADEDPATCAVGCIVETTGVTPICATCYGGVVQCSIDNCLSDCATDPSSEACASCQAENCLDAFYTCTGLEEPVEPVVDACIGEADLAIIEGADADPTTEGDQTVTFVAQGCGSSCLADEDPAACSVACIADTTGVTPICAGCYGGAVACSIENCATDCADDPSSEACGTCQAENCLPAFYGCSGLTPEG